MMRFRNFKPVFLTVLTSTSGFAQDFPEKGSFSGNKAAYYYDSLGNGKYRIRNLSSDGVKPNAFDNGTVLTEYELFKMLVEAGAIKPDVRSYKSRFKIPTNGKYYTNGIGHYFDSLGEGRYRIRALGDSGNGPNRFVPGEVVQELALYTRLVESGAIKPEGPIPYTSRYGIKTSGIYWKDGHGYYYDSLGEGNYRIRSLSVGSSEPNPNDKGTVVTETSLYGTLVETTQIEPLTNYAATKKSRIAWTGTYRKGGHGFYYDSIGAGLYRVRNLSSSGSGPNKFDNGWVVTQDGLFKILVETGACDISLRNPGR